MKEGECYAVSVSSNVSLDRGHADLHLKIWMGAVMLTEIEMTWRMVR